MKLKPESVSERFSDLRSDYDAVKTSRFRRTRLGLPPSGSSADFHLRNQQSYTKLIELARDMDRNDVVVGQAVDRAVTNTLQNGITIDPKTGDSKADELLTELWTQWSEDPEQCDASAEHTFGELQWLAWRHTLVDGDVAALGLESGPLQLVEAHRIRTPNQTKRHVVYGVLLDEQRKHLEYWITRDELNPNRQLMVRDIVPYKVRDSSGTRVLFHLYDSKRVSQTRGLSAFKAVFDTMGMFEDINFAKLVQQQIVSCFAIFHEREIEHRPGAGNQLGEKTTETLADGSVRQLQGISPGMDIHGAPGEKLHGFSPTVPNPGYAEHFRMMLTLFGVNLGLPLVMVLMDASETNFSGWRGAINQARMGFGHNQRCVRDKLVRPVYRWKVAQFIAEHPKLRALAKTLGPAIFKARYNMPCWPYSIQPEKDAKADNMRLENGHTSPRRLAAEKSMDYSDLVVEIVADRAQMIRKAMTEAELIKTEFPQTAADLDWRELGPGNSGIQRIPGVKDDEALTEDKPAKKTEADDLNQQRTGRNGNGVLS